MNSTTPLLLSFENSHFEKLCLQRPRIVVQKSSHITRKNGPAQPSLGAVPLPPFHVALVHCSQMCWPTLTLRWWSWTLSFEYHKLYLLNTTCCWPHYANVMHFARADRRFYVEDLLLRSGRAWPVIKACTHTYLRTHTHAQLYTQTHKEFHDVAHILLTCKRGSVGQGKGLPIPRSSGRFRLKPENSNSHGFELHRPWIKGTKLLLEVIKAIIIMSTKRCETAD